MAQDVGIFWIVAQKIGEERIAGRGVEAPNGRIPGEGGQDAVGVVGGLFRAPGQQAHDPQRVFLGPQGRVLPFLDRIVKRQSQDRAEGQQHEHDQQAAQAESTERLP
jgi:hypothetical protein